MLYRYPNALRKFLQRVLQLKDFITLKVEENDVVRTVYYIPLSRLQACNKNHYYTVGEGSS